MGFRAVHNIKCNVKSAKCIIKIIKTVDNTNVHKLIKNTSSNQSP